MFFHRHLPRPTRLVGIAGTDDEQIGDRAQRRQVLNGLVGRPIFSDADAVVGEGKNRAQVGERGQAYCRAHVVREHEKRCRERDEAAMIDEPIHRGSHGMLADAEVHVAPGVAPAATNQPLRPVARTQRRLEVAVLLEPRVRRRIEIARAANHFGHRARHFLQHRLRSLARRHALCVSREDGELLGPRLGELAGKSAADLVRQLGEVVRVGVEPLTPRLLEGLAAFDCAAEVGQRFVGDGERWVHWPAEILLRPGHFLRAERTAMRLERALLVGRAVSQHGLHRDERGVIAHVLGHVQRLLERVEVVAVVDLLHVPVVGTVARRHVLGEHERGRARECHVVVVVEDDEPSEPEVTGERACLTLDALHHVAIAGEDIGIVAEDLVSRTVVPRCQMGFGDGHPERVADALAERTGRGFDSRGQMALRVPGRQAPPLPEALKLIEREVVPSEMEERIEKRRAMPRREDEAVAIPPARMRWVVAQDPGPQHIGHGCGAHRQPRVARIRLLDHIDGQEAEGIDTELIEVQCCHDGLLGGAGVGVCQPPERAMIRAASVGPQVPG